MNDEFKSFRSIKQGIAKIKPSWPQSVFARIGSATFFSFVSVFDRLIASSVFAVISDHGGMFSRCIYTASL